LRSGEFKPHWASTAVPHRTAEGLTQELAEFVAGSSGTDRIDDEPHLSSVSRITETGKEASRIRLRPNAVNKEVAGGVDQRIGQAVERE
jgi:hypothetical protein